MALYVRLLTLYGWLLDVHARHFGLESIPFAGQRITQSLPRCSAHWFVFHGVNTLHLICPRNLRFIGAATPVTLGAAEPCCQLLSVHWGCHAANGFVVHPCKYLVHMSEALHATNDTRSRRNQVEGSRRYKNLVYIYIYFILYIILILYIYKYILININLYIYIFISMIYYIYIKK